jgi:hypothetical protein
MTTLRQMSLAGALALALACGGPAEQTDAYDPAAATEGDQAPNGAAPAVQAVVAASSGFVAVTASAADEGYPAISAVDGSLSTRWRVPGRGQYITGDLGSTKSVSDVSVAWYRGAERRFTFSIVALLPDGTLRTVFSGQSSGTTNALERYAFAPVSARSMRVVVNGNTENDYANITEMRVTATVMAVSVGVSPASAKLAPGGSTQFSAAVTGTVNTSVSWTVQEGAAGGATTSTGLYTAPSTPGTYHVVATSVVDPTRSAVATVTVTAPAATAPYCDRLVISSAQRTLGALAKPGYLQSVTDPVFGTRITRVTGDVGTAIGSTGQTWSDEAYSIYPKLAAWSAPDAQGRSILQLDMTNQPGAAPIFLDGDTYQPLWVKGSRSAANVFDRRWHPVLPDTAVEVDRTTGDVRFWNVRTDAKTTVYAGRLSSSALVGIGPAEGNISEDGRFVAVSVGRGTSGPPYFFVVDMTACMPAPTAGCAVKRTGNITIASVGISSLDWVSMSPLGKYIIVSRNYQETAVLDWNPATGAVNTTRRAQFGAGHFDMTVGADGFEYAVPGNGDRFKLADGTRSSIWSTGAGSYHAGSVRNGDVTSWTIASLYGSSGAAAGEIVAFGTNGRYYRLGHHRMPAGSSPHAVPSHDGKRVFFGSTWGGSTAAIQGYILDTRELCP